MPQNRGSLAGIFGTSSSQANIKPQASPQVAPSHEELVRQLKAGMRLPFPVLAPPPSTLSPGKLTHQQEDSQGLGQQHQGRERQQGLQHEVHELKQRGQLQQEGPSQQQQLQVQLQHQGQLQQEGPSQQQQLQHQGQQQHPAEGYRGLGGEEEDGEKGIETKESDEEEHAGMVRGASVGLPVMDFVPISINEMKRAARKSGKDGIVGQGTHMSTCQISQNQMSCKEKDAVKRKYIMGLEEDPEDSDSEAGGKSNHSKKQRSGLHHKAQKLKNGHSASQRGSLKTTHSRALDSDNSDSSDSVDAFGDSGSGRLHKGGKAENGSLGRESVSSDEEVGGHRGAQDGVVAFDYASAYKLADEAKRANMRRQASQADAQNSRGGRGGRGNNRGSRGQQQRGGRGGRGGRPAFNPYHIPDENLIKAGKRSTVMPRSGNRTLTFK